MGKFESLAKHKLEKPNYVILDNSITLSESTYSVLNNHRNFALGNTVKPVINLCTDLHVGISKSSLLDVIGKIAEQTKEIYPGNLIKGAKWKEDGRKVFCDTLKELREKGLMVTTSDKSNQLVVAESEYIQKMETVISDLFIVE